MLALVTGACGFVGRHLTRHLRAAGDDVIESDPQTGGPRLEDAEGVRDLIVGARPDAVYHLAGQSDVGRSWSNPTATFRTNAMGTLAVVQACVEAKVGRLLFVTSADVYGYVDEADLPVDENTPLRPISPYAASKAAAEMVCLQAHLASGLEVVRARAFNHLGPGQGDRFVAGALAARIAACEVNGTDTVAVGALDARRDFTDVRDVVSAYRLLVNAGEPGAIYNVCSGRDIGIVELAGMLLARAARPLRLVDDPLLHRPVDVHVMRGDPTRIRDDTGWRPEIPLETTVADVLADARRALAQRNGR